MTRSYWTDKQERAYENACIYFAEHGEIRIGNSLDHVDISKEEILIDMAGLSAENGIHELLESVVSEKWPSAAKMFNLAGKVREAYNAKANELIADAITDYVEPR